MNRRILMRAGFGLAWMGALAAAGQTPGARIEVGPNILVSRDGDSPHVELIAASNPKNAKNLAGAAITYLRPQGGTACRTYASVDGGSTWKASEFAEQVEWGGGDPYVVFTPKGTAIFTGLSFIKDEKNQTRAALHAYRSEDGGLTWQKPADLGYSYDHEQVTVDPTLGRFAGRVYIGVLYGPYPLYQVGVFRSDDDGRTWTGPVEAANGGGTIGINDVNLMVLSDGTLVVPYADFEMLPGKAKTAGKITNNAWLALSQDGGVTFGAPRKIQTMHHDFDDKEASRVDGFPALAADNGSGAFKDRIYVAWPDARYGRLRILFTRSEDRGLHWSAPVLLDGNVPKAALQYQPVVAVNKEGVVGVTWFDTRDSKDGSQYHQYFSASADGGKTFLPPVRVSFAPSTPRGAGNMTFGAFSGRYKETTYLSLVSAASRWVSGGDYMGLSADKDGVFHPFWSDARSGTFQIYSAAVSVVLPPKEKPAAAGASGRPAAGAAKPAAARSKAVLDTTVELIFDPTRYDGATREAEIPIRLRNTSKQAIYPPLTLEILGFDLDDPDIPKYPYPEMSVANAANGKTGAGAVFDFSAALGSHEALEPGAQTNPVVIRFKFTDPAEVPAIRYRLEGMVEEAR